MFGTYQPTLPPDVIHRLWLLKRRTGIPMTKLLREAIELYLTAREAN